LPEVLQEGNIKSRTASDMLSHLGDSRNLADILVLDASNIKNGCQKFKEKQENLNYSRQDFLV